MWREIVRALGVWLSVVCVSCTGMSGAWASDGINAVLGDESWVARYGEAPGEGVSESERHRVHLEHVIGVLRAADVSGLSCVQRANRGRALDGLEEHNATGSFPRRDPHDGFSGRRPQFIDSRGVHCAVGEMLRRTGHGELAQRIDGEHEFSYVPDIDTQGLAEWAHEYGFSVHELAMIQPTYHSRTFVEDLEPVIVEAVRSHTTNVLRGCRVQHSVLGGAELHVIDADAGRVDVIGIEDECIERGFVGVVRNAMDDHFSDKPVGSFTVPLEPDDTTVGVAPSCLRWEDTGCSPLRESGLIVRSVEVSTWDFGVWADVIVRSSPEDRQYEDCIAEFVLDFHDRARDPSRPKAGYMRTYEVSDGTMSDLVRGGLARAALLPKTLIGVSSWSDALVFWMAAFAALSLMGWLVLSRLGWRTSRQLVFVASLLVVVMGLTVSMAHASSVNEVIGDESWVAAHGVEPGDEVGEVERIGTHLRFVIARLERADVSSLSQAQRRNRARALAGLSEYVEAGVFPVREADDGFSGRRPRFIDSRGVHCAVGEMLRRTGHGELAQRIDGEHEFSFVPEINTPGLAGWAHEHGLSVRELAMIQPSYDYPQGYAYMDTFVDSSRAPAFLVEHGLDWRETGCIPFGLVSNRVGMEDRVYEIIVTLTRSRDELTVHVDARPEVSSYEECIEGYLARRYSLDELGLVGPSDSYQARMGVRGEFDDFDKLQWWFVGVFGLHAMYVLVLFLMLGSLVLFGWAIRLMLRRYWPA